MLDKTKSNSALPIGFNLRYDRIFSDDTHVFNINDLKALGLTYPFPNEERNNQYLDVGTCNCGRPAQDESAGSDDAP